jgi:hypothetical protein
MGQRRRPVDRPACGRELDPRTSNSCLYARTVETYLTLPALSSYVLEESWVLAVTVQPAVVTLDLDLCYATDHPELRAPRDGEWAYFRRGLIRFTDVTSVSWQEMGQRAATDASGESDWGHIDSFEWAGTAFSLEGDFGVVQLQAAAVNVDLTGPA